MPQWPLWTCRQTFQSHLVSLMKTPSPRPQSYVGPTAATIVGPADFNVAATADDPPLPVPDSADSEFQQPLSTGCSRGRRGKGQATTRQNGKWIDKFSETRMGCSRSQY